MNVNETDGLRECIICQYWYFLGINFIFQPKVCNSCHDLMQKVTSFNDVAIATVKETDYRIHLLYMCKDEIINLLRNSDLTEKTEPHKT